MAALLLAFPFEARGMGPACESPGTVLELTVHWFDPTQKLQSARGPVMELVVEIFETASVRLHWAESKNDVRRDAVAVILLPDGPQAPYVPAQTLGATTDDERRRFVYVYFKPVLRGAGLEKSLDGLSTGDAVIFWRALSRVVAHEIVHSLVPGGKHAESGIMSAELTPVMLQRSRLDLDLVTKCQIRSALGARERCEAQAQP